MGNKDSAIKSTIEECLQRDPVGQNLKAYFENLPDKDIRRAITVLANMYPVKDTIADEELVFITYMLANEKIIGQQSFHAFIFSIGLIEYSESQKKILISVIKRYIEPMCCSCTFELDHLIVKLFAQHELIQFMNRLMADSSATVLQHISDILRYENSFARSLPDTVLVKLRHDIFYALQQKRDSSCSR